jgi:membrane-associated phospholipid phosphatase
VKQTAKRAPFRPLPLVWWHWLLAASLILLAVALFLELAEDVWIKQGFSWDAPLLLLLGGWRSAAATLAMRGISASASVFVILPVLATIVWQLRRREKAQAITLAVGLSLSSLVSAWLKAVFARLRPDVIPPLTVEHTSSFPSGHTLTAVVFYGFLAVEAWRHGRRGVAVALATWALLVGLSRVYLGAHYPSDVLASVALGLIFLTIMRTFLGLSYRFHKMAA